MGLKSPLKGQMALDSRVEELTNATRNKEFTNVVKCNLGIVEIKTVSLVFSLLLAYLLLSPSLPLPSPTLLVSINSFLLFCYAVRLCQMVVAVHRVA